MADRLAHSSLLLWGYGSGPRGCPAARPFPPYNACNQRLSDKRRLPALFSPRAPYPGPTEQGTPFRVSGRQVNGALVSLNVIAYKSRASLDRRWGVDGV